MSNRRKPTPELERKHRMAAWLTRLSGGRLDVKHSPDSILVEEGEGRDEDDKGGYVFDAGIPCDSGFDQTDLLLDDRKGQIAEQLVKELRRVGRLHLSLATQMESAIASRTPIPARDDAFAVVVIKRPNGWQPPDRGEIGDYRKWEAAELESAEMLALFEMNIPGEDEAKIRADASVFGRSEFWTVVRPMDDVAWLPSWREYAAANGIELGFWDDAPAKTAQGGQSN